MVKKQPLEWSLHIIPWRYGNGTLPAGPKWVWGFGKMLHTKIQTWEKVSLWPNEGDKWARTYGVWECYEFPCGWKAYKCTERLDIEIIEETWHAELPKGLKWR